MKAHWPWLSATAALLLLTAACSKIGPSEVYVISCACPQGLPSYSGETTNPTFADGLWKIPFKNGNGLSAPVITQCICNAIPKMLMPQPTVTQMTEPTPTSTPTDEPSPKAKR